LKGVGVAVTCNRGEKEEMKRRNAKKKRKERKKRKEKKEKKRKGKERKGKEKEEDVTICEILGDLGV